MEPSKTNGVTHLDDSSDLPSARCVSPATDKLQEVLEDNLMTTNDTRGNVQSPIDDTLETAYNEPTCKPCIASLIDHNVTTIFMTIVTIYALFGDDVRMLVFAKSADDVFYGLSVAALFFFLLELVLSCYAKPDYFNSFYFWLDLVATVSLVPDIGWIWFPIIGQEEDTDDSSNDAEQIQNAGKASRAGTRTSRIIRIIRLIRLIRIVKLYKNAQKALKEKDEEGAVQDEADLHIPSESRVGKKLSDRTTKRVIMLVLTMLLILPLFEANFYIERKKSWEFGVEALDQLQDQPGYVAAREEFIDYHEDRRRPLVKLSQDIGNDDTWTWESSTDPDDLRTVEKSYGTAGDFVSIVDLTEDTKLEAGLNIAKTVFVCIVLALGAIYFNKDANELVLIPIERMIDKVQRIAKNPIAHMNEEDPADFFKLEQSGATETQTEDEKRRFWQCGKTKQDTQYETEVLENTIVKIGALLALGFGEAGSAIIGTNMEKQGDINPMLEGNKIIAIFGFCDIRQFTDTTEVLQEGVMIFVNEIAYIVHGIVDRYLGAANKNIGDAFLLVWKFQPADLMLTEDGDVLLRKDSMYVSEVADLALLSFLKIIIKVNRDPKLLRYKKHVKLNELMPNYSVKMGFGLHVGWAIEGAIGSEFKIDASYLSPNVNMASRLEAATKQYGVPVLISGSINQILSPSVREKCRHIDTVTVKGSSVPMELYTCDLDVSTLPPSLDKPGKYDGKKQAKMKKSMLRKIGRGEMAAASLYEASREFRLAREHWNNAFESLFAQGVRAYVQGNWSEAKSCFDECLNMKPRDGPTLTLVEYMGETGFTKPANWDGYRMLTEK